MSRQPVTIDAAAALSQALQLMRAHDVRHLPVIDHDRIVGIVSQRDLQLLDAGGRDLAVKEAMVGDPYLVYLDAPLDEVAACMAARRIGSAIVIDRHGKLQGIFTSADALESLSEILQRVTE